MAGSPSELLRTSDHLKGDPEATRAHWAAVEAAMGKKSVAESEAKEEESETLAEPVYSD